MFDSPAHGDASMPRREGVGFVLERIEPTPHAVDAPPAKTREEGEGYAPTITYFCASSKFSTSSGTSSSESDPSSPRFHT